MSDAIDGRDVNAVGDGVGALHQLPGLTLGGPQLCLLPWVPADRRRIEQNRRTLQGRQASSLGIPLIPAHQHANASKARIEGAKTQVARREIILLVVKRIVRDVHFAVKSKQAAVGVKNGCGVVVNPGRPALEQRSHDRGPRLSRDLAQALAGRARNRFGEIEQCGVLALAEVNGTEELLQANDLSAARGSLLNTGDRLGDISLGFGITAHLHEADDYGVRWWSCHRETHLFMGSCLWHLVNIQ